MERNFHRLPYDVYTWRGVSEGGHLKNMDCKKTVTAGEKQDRNTKKIKKSFVNKFRKDFEIKYKLHK